MARRHPFVAFALTFCFLLLGAQLVDCKSIFHRSWLLGRQQDTSQTSSAAAGDQYLIGVGKADITGFVDISINEPPRHC
jgi:hypothetical protein